MLVIYLGFQMKNCLFMTDFDVYFWFVGIYNLGFFLNIHITLESVF